ncbi:Transcription factor spt8 [Lobulomyces angularis]|nr:Transcription factor spt8 [Lobulomyces angularis]
MDIEEKEEIDDDEEIDEIIVKTKDLVEMGGEDGFIRKYDFIPSYNGESLLTQTQRHGLAESIINAGILVSAWEVEDVVTPPVGSTPQPTIETPVKQISPVYSIDVQSEGIWLLAGMESGAINLYSVRHEEGQCHYTFTRHKQVVSVIKISPDEKSFLSGSWDRQILQWDLNTGEIISSYAGPISQITSISIRSTPVQKSFIPVNASNDNDNHNHFSFLVTTFDGVVWIFDSRSPNEPIKKIPPSTGCPPWALSACWSKDDSKIYCGRRNGSIDEIDFYDGSILRSIKLPKDSGPVYYVMPMLNNTQILCASFDNIRLWDLKLTPESAVPSGTNTPKQPSQQKSLGMSESNNFGKSPMKDPLNKKLKNFLDDTLTPVVPFSIIPGHHGGVISTMITDLEGKILITASGTKGWEGISNNNCLVYSIIPKD